MHVSVDHKSTFLPSKTGILNIFSPPCCACMHLSHHLTQPSLQEIQVYTDATHLHSIASEYIRDDYA